MRVIYVHVIFIHLRLPAVCHAITGWRVHASPGLQLAACETLASISSLMLSGSFQLFLWRISGREATILHTRSCKQIAARELGSSRTS